MNRMKHLAKNWSCRRFWNQNAKQLKTWSDRSILYAARKNLRKNMRIEVMKKARKEGLLMKHLFRKGNDVSKRTLLLLHGTGGTEHDLLPLAEKIDPDASVLSVRGNVSENGMLRFFKRLAEGVFDVEDLVYRTKELNAFL